MNAYIGITDYDWFKLLSAQDKIEEINFWQPGGNRIFSAIQENELFLFKLHSPRDFVVGGGFFAHSTILPVSIAWDTFGIANGSISLDQMRERIGKYRREQPIANQDYKIGCILLAQPFFFTEQNWIPIPNDWKTNIVQGKRYDLSMEPGLSLYNRISQRIQMDAFIGENYLLVNSPSQRYGAPVEILPRLGQGGFKVIVTDAYNRKCAVSNEKVLPVLEASHIRPYSKGGDHKPENGILLRSDIHTLFDKGYLTITPDYHVEVSRKIREDYENGRDYYAFHGNTINLPRNIVQKPSRENLEWHNGIFLG
jgi:putative restriction endonuclease